MNQIVTEVRRNLVAGILVVLPLAVTVFILRWSFNNIVLPLTQRIRSIVLFIVPDSLEGLLGLERTFGWNLLGLLLFFLFILFLGVLTRNIVGNKLIRVGERLLEKIPIVGKVYTTTQQIGQAFLGEKGTGFRRVILFEYPRAGLYTFGLVSGEAKGEVQEKTGEKVLNVFVPTTPNPTSGLLILVPEKETIPVDMSVADALRLLVSGGTVSPIRRK